MSPRTPALPRACSPPARGHVAGCPHTASSSDGQTAGSLSHFGPLPQCWPLLDLVTCPFFEPPAVSEVLSWPPGRGHTCHLAGFADSRSPSGHPSGDESPAHNVVLLLVWCSWGATHHWGPWVGRGSGSAPQNAPHLSRTQPAAPITVQPRT